MEQAFFSVPEVAQILGIGETKARELVTTGKLGSIRLADSRIGRVPAPVLKQYIDEQTKLATESHGS